MGLIKTFPLPSSSREYEVSKQRVADAADRVRRLREVMEKLKEDPMLLVPEEVDTDGEEEEEEEGAGGGGGEAKSSAGEEEKKSGGGDGGGEKGGDGESKKDDGGGGGGDKGDDEAAATAETEEGKEKKSSEGESGEAEKEGEGGGRGGNEEKVETKVDLDAVEPSSGTVAAKKTKRVYDKQVSLAPFLSQFLSLYLISLSLSISISLSFVGISLFQPLLIPFDLVHGNSVRVFCAICRREYLNRYLLKVRRTETKDARRETIRREKKIMDEEKQKYC